MDDLISRDDVYNVLKKVNIREMPIYVFDKLWNGVRDLPSAEPESEDFEWYHDCKEYDQDKHCCHRWTKVIRNTVEEIKTKYWKWIPVTEALPKNYEQTICIDSRGKMMIGTYGEYGWMFPCYMTEPVAWMSLPEPTIIGDVK